ncbi:MAG: L-fucose/L-arabinose isomerase family protein [Anaerolineales bacterium]|nr:L-fucose/L-arabinose isomerase family protein [Anaerolineales bacterium]
MEKPIVGFMVTAAEHFPYEQPNALNAQAREALSKLDMKIIPSERLVYNPSGAMEAAATFKAAGIDLLISLVGSFTWDNMPVRVAQELNVPIILWGVPEPPMHGGRLEANSLVGVTMNAAALTRLGFQYKHVYGFPNDPATLDEIARTVRVIATIKRLRHTRLGIVGGRPPGFYGSTYDELRLRKSLGVEIIPIEVSEVLAEYERVSDTQEAEIAGRISGMGRRQSAEEIDLRQTARLYSAMQTFVKNDDISGIAVKCWPELKDRLLNPCVVNGMMIDEGVMMGCETDVHGTISMLIQNFLNGKPPFFADLVTFDEAENTALFWHCGAAAASLAASQEELYLEKHSIGSGSTTLEFAMRQGRVTIARLGPIGEDYRLLILTGDAVSTPMLLRGNNMLIRTDLPVRQVIDRIIERGIEHHYSATYGDLHKDLIEFCKWTGIHAETLEN